MSGMARGPGVPGISGMPGRVDFSRLAQAELTEVGSTKPTTNSSRLKSALPNQLRAAAD